MRVIAVRVRASYRVCVVPTGHYKLRTYQGFLEANDISNLKAKASFAITPMRVSSIPLRTESVHRQGLTRTVYKAKNRGTLRSHLMSSVEDTLLSL